MDDTDAGASEDKAPQKTARTEETTTAAGSFTTAAAAEEDEVPVLDDKLLELGPRIAIHSLDTLEQCVHEVAVPPSADYVELRPPTAPPAKEYPFVLDPFQNRAILCLQNSQSVLVSAHTSAGKTVVAESVHVLSLIS